MVYHSARKEHPTPVFSSHTVLIRCVPGLAACRFKSRFSAPLCFVSRQPPQLPNRPPAKGICDFQQHQVSRPVYKLFTRSNLSKTNITVLPNHHGRTPDPGQQVVLELSFNSTLFFKRSTSISLPVFPLLFVFRQSAAPPSAGLRPSQVSQSLR